MKILMLIVLAFSLSMVRTPSAQGQNSSQNGSQASQDNQDQGSQNQGSQNQGRQNQGSQAQTNSTNGHNMSATVSQDGKSITNDKNDKTYKVDNPDALQGKEGQHVMVIVHYDPATNMMHIIQVAAPQQ